MSIGYYASLSELAQAIDQIDMTDTDQIERFRRLIRVYMDASQNPPDGVVGVCHVDLVDCLCKLAQ